jgi:hypothetical protein
MPVDDEQISYREWGEQFFRTAISEERILAAVDDLAGQPIDFGPMGVGPGGLAKLRAYGEVGRALASALPAEEQESPISYRVLVPVSLSFEVDLQVETHRFHAELLVPLTLTARALDGVRIYVDVVPPEAGDVQVSLRAEGLRASIVKRVGNLEAELQRFVARYVTRELAKPQVEQARTIDVAAMIDKAWASLARPKPRGGVIDDLNAALESEILAHEDEFLDPGAR